MKSNSKEQTRRNRVRLDLLRKTILELHQALSPAGSEMPRGSHYVHHNGLGGLSLTDDENQLVWQTTEDLRSASFPAHDANSYPVSAKYLRSLLDQVLIRCLVVEDDPRSIEERIEAYCIDLLEMLDEAPIETQVISAVVGGKMREKSLQFGGVTLHRVDDAYLEGLNRRIDRDIDLTADSEDTKASLKARLAERSREHFSDKIAIEILQQAIDRDAAEELASYRLNRALQCLNLIQVYAPFARPGNTRLGLPGDQERTWSLTLIRNEKGSSFPHRAVGPVVPMDIPDSLRTNQMQSALFARLSEMLERSPTKFERLVLRAIEISSIAIRTKDPAQAVAWTMSALEVLCVHKGLGSITKQLGRHVSALVSPPLFPDPARPMLIEEIYDRRSRFLHEGESDVPVRFLDLSWQYLRIVLYRLLIESPFREMQTITELKSWFKHLPSEDPRPEN